jgi:RNA-directed DNA polymerase
MPELASFDFLGFTHVWIRSLKGSWVINLKTTKGRFTRALQRITLWCKESRHFAVKEQHQALSSKLLGLRVLRHHRELAGARAVSA